MKNIINKQLNTFKKNRILFAIFLLQLPEYMQNLKDQLRNELKSTSMDRRSFLEAELQRLQDERRKVLLDKDKEREHQLKRELDRLSSATYAGSLSLKQR